MNPLDAAREYLRRGWSPIPIPRGEKKPALAEWQNLRLGEGDLLAHFGDGSNIGVLTGTPSGDLIDIDLDCAEAVALAESFLPRTQMWSGRTQRPRSHAWYRVTGSIPGSASYKDVDKTVLVELRAGGRQTVVAPSVHPD